MGRYQSVSQTEQGSQQIFKQEVITDKVGGSSAKPEVSKQSKEKRLKHKVSGYKSQSKRRLIAGCRLLLRTLNRIVVQWITSREVKLQSLVCFMVTRCRARIEISEPIWINGQIIIYLLQKCLNRQSVGRKMEDDDLTDHNLVDYICLPGNQGCRFGPGTREFPGYYEGDPRLLS